MPAILASLLMLLAALGGFARGAYDIELWGPAGMVLLGVLTASVFAIPSRPRSLALVAVLALAGLCGWSFLSTLWAESVDRALVDSYRLLAYVAAFGFLLLATAASHPRLRALPLGAAAAGVIVVALSILVQLLGGDAGDLFAGSRLNGPIGYFNAEGAFFILGFWPLVAAAVGWRTRAGAAVVVGVAVLLVDLVVLTQSRGALLALIVSAVVVALVHRPRTPAVGALVAVGIGVAVAVPALADITGAVEQPGSAGQRSAALAMLAGATLASLSHLVGGWVAARLGGQSRVMKGIRLATAVVFAMAAVGVAIVVAPRVSDEVRAFKDLRQPEPQARLFTVGGNRYDYWRVAAISFERDPLIGVGAGNYDLTYFQERRTAEDIRQPHSLPLQTLAELGLVGGAALALFVLSVLTAVWRWGRPPDAGGTPPWVLAAGAMFLAWVLHSTIDWTHQMPAVTALALGAAAALLAPWQRREELLPRRTLGVACLVAISAVSLVGAGGLGRFARANDLADDAQARIQSDPSGAESRASASLRLNEHSLRTRYIQAAALAQLGDPRGAEAVLEEAAAREPHRSLTWALLGDLAIRGGRLERAQKRYQRASELNPQDPALKRLATDRRLLRQLQRNPDAPIIG